MDPVGIESPSLNLLRQIIDISDVDCDYPNPSRNYFSLAKERLNTPVDVIDLPSAYQVIVDMPGVEKCDIKVNVELGKVNIMSIVGERRNEQVVARETMVAMERRTERFVSKIILPENAITDCAPTVVDGVVTINIWKRHSSNEDKVPTRNISAGSESAYPFPIDLSPVLVPTPLPLVAPMAIIDAFENALLNTIHRRHQQQRDIQVESIPRPKRKRDI